MFEGLDRDAFALAKEHDFFETERDTMNFTERFQSALAEFNAAGLNATSYCRMLALMKLHGPRKMQFFTDILNVSSAAMTGMADKLADMGLIERINLPQDRRANFLQLTTQGTNFINLILP